MKSLRKHLTVANVLSCMALFVALSGVAYAAALGKNAVKTKNIANGAVTTAKLRNGGVTTAKLRNGAVNGAKVAPGSIGSSQLANGSVRSGQLGGGVVTEAKLKNGAVSESKLGANAVSTGKLAEGAVTGAKLAPSFFFQLVKNISYVNRESGAVSATSPQSAIAECPVGKQAIAGGARIIAGDATVVQLTESIPFLGAAGIRTGWTASAKTSEAGKTFAVEAFAVCAEL